jgi:Acetyltransferase (GNAT) domain
MTRESGSLRSRSSMLDDAPQVGTLISLQVHPGTPPDGWDDTVRALGGSIFHSALWASYQRREGTIEPLFLLGLDREGTRVAVALALESSSSRAITARLFRDLRLTAHPVVRGADPAVASAFIRGIEQLARTRGCTRLDLDSFMSGTSPLRPAEHGFVEAERVEFSLDLGREGESLWQGIRKDQREKVRRLKREGVVITEGTSLDDLRSLGAAREATQSRREERGQGYDLPSDGGFYEALYRHLVGQGAARLFIARQTDTVLAAILFSTFNRRAYSVYSGSTDSGYRLGAQSGLFWAAVETFKAEGFRELNRGGVPGSAANEGHPLHGIYTFKLRLGTTPQDCRSGVKVLDQFRNGLRRIRDRFHRTPGGRSR